MSKQPDTPIFHVGGAADPSSEGARETWKAQEYPTDPAVRIAELKAEASQFRTRAVLTVLLWLICAGVAVALLVTKTDATFPALLWTGLGAFFGTIGILRL